MDVAVPLQSLVANGLHVLLLIHEVLQGVALEVFDALLTGPAALLFLLFPVNHKEFVDDFEKPLVLLVDDLHSDIVLFLPYQLIVHMAPPLIQASAFFTEIVPAGLRWRK